MVGEQGTRLANTVRNELFIRIIHQDIAYFDSARTGDLISRLSGDVGALVAPFRTMISTLLSSTISLFGASMHTLEHIHTYTSCHTVCTR